MTAELTMYGATRCLLTGSTAIYGKGNDVDYIVLVEDVNKYIDDKVAGGWAGGPGYRDSDFVSLRKDDVNLLVTKQQWLFDAFSVATTTAMAMVKALPQDNKEARVRLFETIRELYKEAHYDTV